MIAYLNPLQGEEFVRLCGVEPVIGARICSWFSCYANAYPFCDLWILYSDTPNPAHPKSNAHDGWPHGVAARYQGTLCIACDLDADFDELAGFIAASGAAEVECVQPVMDRLIGKIPFRLRQRQQVLTYEFGREDAPGGIPAGVLAGDRFIYSDHLDCDPAEFVENTRLREMYEVICQSFDGYREGTPFTGWYVDAFARIKKAEGYLCGICRDGKVVSVAGVYNVSPYTAMVSSVATLPDYRGRGLARRCVRRCLEYIRYLDVRPTLTAATDSLVDYYRGLGFREYAVRCSAIYQRKP